MSKVWWLNKDGTYDEVYTSEPYMIIQCDSCNGKFIDSQMQVPNHCPVCGKTVMSQAELTVIGFIRTNYLGFEYVPMLSTLNVEHVQKQLVVKCLKCDEIIRMTGFGDMKLMGVETYCAGVIRGVLERHIVMCEQKRSIIKTPKKSNFEPQPSRQIDLEE